MRILVVEDERKTAAFLAKGLREAGFAVDLARDGETGLTLARATTCGRRERNPIGNPCGKAKRA